MIQYCKRYIVLFFVLAATISCSHAQAFGSIITAPIESLVFRISKDFYRTQLERGLRHECILNYATDFPDRESVLLWNSDSLIQPKKNAIILNANDVIIVACPGSRNTLVKTGTKFTTAKCVSGQTLKVGTTNYLFSDLSCTISVTGEHQATTTACGAFRGVIKSIGHNVNSKFLTLFDICYDNNNGEALYADHIIFGSAISYAKSVPTRPTFKVPGLAPGVNADAAYRQTSQLSTFTDLLGSEALAKQYIFSNSYLARGHLAPDADQVFVTSSLSTYFYINTVPQWQQINNCNWKSCENSVRKLAENTREDIKVITGGWKVLQLKDINGNLVNMYLSGKKLPVPKLVWKIAYSSVTKKGIAFVSVNNPFITELTTEEYICTDICNEYGWGNHNWSIFSKGLVYCCDINELRNIVNTIPALNVNGILMGPGSSNADYC